MKHSGINKAFGALIMGFIYLYFITAICLTLQFFSIPIYYYLGIMGADIDFKTVYFFVTSLVITWGVAQRFWFSRYDRKK